jgi:hypothetical protein
MGPDVAKPWLHRAKLPSEAELLFVWFRHGYAGTIYKGQGKTLDHTYLLHSHHWRSSASYVALTRQCESAQLFVATETARDVRQLTRQMARGEVRAASVAWATADELAPVLRQRTAAPTPTTRDRQRSRSQPGAGREAETGSAATERAQAATVVRQPPAAHASGQSDAAASGQGGWLIPPRVAPDGKDSLGRGLDGGSIAAVIAANPAVQREREARWSYLQGAYRDPYGAHAALDELVKRQGWTSAAARVTADPLQLAMLRGKEGFFAGAKARAERGNAQRAAGAIGPSLERIGAVEASAERTYRTGVEMQRAADATGISRLSARAGAAIGTIAAAPDDRARGEAWQVVQTDQRVAGELHRFAAAVERRFGEEGIRAMLRAGGRSGTLTAPSVAPAQQRTLDQVAGLTATLKAGERAGAAAARRQAQGERHGPRRGLRM